MLVRQLAEHIAEHFDGAANVALEDDVQFLLPAVFNLLGQAFQRDARALGQRGFTRLGLAILGDTAGLLAIGHDHQLIAGLRQILPVREFRPE